MKNLTFKIDYSKNQVTFSYVHNTLVYTSTSELISQKNINGSQEQFYSNLVDRIAEVCLEVDEINSGNNRFFVESFKFYDDKKNPIVIIERDRGICLNKEQKGTYVHKIHSCIEKNEPFTDLTLFELRTNDLAYIEFNDKIYIHQIDGYYVRF